MSWALVEDIVRIICLCISLCSALFVLICALKNGKHTHLRKLLDWFEKSFADGKITSDELKEGIEIIKELSDLIDKDKKE